MAITKMKRLELVGLNSERKRLIEYLQRCGVVDLSDSRGDELKSRETASQISQFEAYMSSAAAALDILRPYAATKSGMFTKRKEADDDRYAVSDGEMMAATALVNEVLSIRKKREKNEEEIVSADAAINALEPYMALDAPLGIRRVGRVAIRLGTLDGDWNEEQLWDEFREAELDAVYFEILSHSKQQTAVWIMYPYEQTARFETVFAKINLIAPAISLTGQTPAECAEEIRKKRTALMLENDELLDKMKACAKRKDEIELFYDKISVRRDKYRALSKIGITENAFFISGYLPAEGADELLGSINERFTVAAELIEPEESEDVPKAFENNGLVSPVEGITSDYAMPSEADIDPNPIMAIFYYFFFGMMFSDAGYGLLLMIVCGILGFSNLMEKSKRRAYKMFFFCGVSTTFWGILYGSFFGDMIATVSKTFGDGSVAFAPILLDPVAKPLELLIMSVAFGLIHILTAIAVKFYMTWRQGDRLGAVFDSGFWFVLLLGVGIFAAGMGLGISVLQTVGMWMAIICAVGLVLTQGRDKKNPVMKLLGGIISLYDVTSYVSDLLSYSRLMALGLTTGVIASVVNVLASMGGRSVVGVIMFVLISIFGHTLNFAINMLGAYVHTNRLQYVEFYQKFYEGGGRKYKPFGYNTKYFRFKNITK